MFYYRKFLFLLMIAIAIPQITEAGDTFDREYHRDWFSERGKNPTTIESYMCTKDGDGTSLVIYFGKGNNCSVGYPAIIYQGINGNNTSVKKFPGVLRIDDGEMVDIVYSIRVIDGAAFIAVEGANGNTVFKDAVDGRRVQFSFYVEGKGTRFLSYSLMGFTAAYKRAQNLCRGISTPKQKPQKKDKDFFEGGTGMQKKKDTGEDASYF